jgi:membrane protease YdiL (CAAX protease family)
VANPTNARALMALRDSFGPWALLGVLIVAAPIYEELLFRGVLLDGFSRHLSFGWANLLQAGLFGLIHADLPRLPFYFAVGVFTGVLRRRTGGLLAGVVLHASNNALASLVLLD